MALGKYTRVDGRKSSTGYCSTITFVAFVGLCLVGVWMMTSSSVPVQNVDETSHESKNELRTEQVAENSNEGNPINESNKGTESQPKQFEDNPGDLPEDATKGDNSVPINTNAQPEKTTENPVEENPEEMREKQTGGEETNSESGSKIVTGNEQEKKGNVESNVEGKDTEAGETRADAVDKNSEAGETDGRDKKTEAGEKNMEGEDSSSGGDGKSDEGSNENTQNMAEKSEEKSGELKEGDKTEGQIEEKKSEENTGEKKEVFPSGAQSELLNETVVQDGAWKTQAAESKKETNKASQPDQLTGYNWKLCNVTAGTDYIPCLDNWLAIKSLRSTKHYEHRERHCPDDPPTCLVPLPEGYQRSIEWPTSREKVY